MHPSYHTGPVGSAKNQFEVIEALQELGTDPTVDIWFPVQAHHPDVKTAYWREKSPDGQGFLRCRRYETPAGILQQKVKETPDWDSPEHMLFSRTTCGDRAARTPDLEMMDDFNSPRSVEVLIKGEEDLERMRYLFQPLTGKALELWREEALYARKFAEKNSLFLHARRTFNGSAVLWLCRVEDFMCHMVDNPGYVERFLRIIQDWQNWALGIVLDVGVDMVSRFGLYEGPSYWGARYFERYLVPLIEEETRIVHAGGALHAQGQSDGMTAYKDLLKGMSLDVLMGVDEVQGKDDFEVLKKELGESKSFVGGVNSDVTLGKGSEEEIGRAVIRAIRTLSRERRARPVARMVGLPSYPMVSSRIPDQGVAHLQEEYGMKASAQATKSGARAARVMRPIPSKSKLLEMYRLMVLARRFDESVVDLYAAGQIPGFMHLYIGEEAVAVGSCAALGRDDFITSTHRGHGHCIAKGGDPRRMMAELFAKADGYCKGKGGSMHIACLSLGILGANGIVGGGFPIANGAALSSQILGKKNVAVCFFGDGASNEGSFHEALNLAGVWKLPVVFVCENNGYAQTTPQAEHQAIRDIAGRAASYGMPGVVADGMDVLDVFAAVGDAVAAARLGKGSSLVECKTYRYRGHWEGDPQPYRTEEEIGSWKKKDCIASYERRLHDELGFDAGELDNVRREVDEKISESIAFARACPAPIRRMPSPMCIPRPGPASQSW